MALTPLPLDVNRSSDPTASLGWNGVIPGGRGILCLTEPCSGIPRR